MKRFLLLAGVLVSVFGGSSFALDPVTITANRTLETAKDEKAPKHATQVGHDGSYEIEVTNGTSKDLGPLVVQYRIFIEREQLGAKRTGDTVERVEGSVPQPVIAARQKATVTTKGFSLNESKMKSNLKTAYVPAVKGGRVEAKDSTKGIWVRVYQGDTVVGELINPPTLKDHERWDKLKPQ